MHSDAVKYTPFRFFIKDPALPISPSDDKIKFKVTGITSSFALSSSTRDICKIRQYPDFTTGSYQERTSTYCTIAYSAGVLSVELKFPPGY